MVDVRDQPVVAAQEGGGAVDRHAVLVDRGIARKHGCVVDVGTRSVR